MKVLVPHIAAILLLVSSCAGVPSEFSSSDTLPGIFPDYTDVTVPQTIAPLNFRLTEDGADAAVAVLSSGSGTITVKGPEFSIPEKGWKTLMSAPGEVCVQVYSRNNGKWTAWKAFPITVSPDEMDNHLVYRLIEPGYETWNNMGIYQRDLGSFDQKAIISNDRTDKNCMNCHSFCNRNPEKMMFHMRATNGGTYVWNEGKLEKLNTKTPETISALVYPGWHPSGNIIAFSVNDIAQSFHSTNRNRIEVYDSASDVVVYDVENHQVVSTPELMKPETLETFPSFSPDGRTLYFCSSPQQVVPDDYDKIRYSICSISFNPEDMSFGDTVDTLYSAHATGRCAVFPRVSPDGNYLLYTETDYGCFPIWHKDADLRLMDLRTGTVSQLEGVNSDDVESYHSWSSNSRWFVFSSRRMDGLYTRPFICHLDENGNPSKPFPLPQKDSRFYDEFLKSFNIPEFVSGSVKVSPDEIASMAKTDAGTNISFRKD